ncbi:MAG: hypothetical protein JO112_10280 [Planctomycetes bacterium]|nr:hypothetical protein [Planctomycetota bacterium]
MWNYKKALGPAVLAGILGLALSAHSLFAQGNGQNPAPGNGANPAPAPDNGQNPAPAPAKDNGQNPAPAPAQGNNTNPAPAPAQGHATNPTPAPAHGTNPAAAPKGTEANPNPGTGTGGTSFANPYSGANPLAGAASNPLAAGFANPYAGSATLTTQGSLPGNAGYGPGSGSMSSNPAPAEPPYTPYSGYGGISYTDPYAGYLNGSAKVIDAQGKFMNDIQNANLKKQEVFQKMLESRKLAQDEFNQEQQSRLSAREDERDLQNRIALRRSMNEAPLNDVLAGASLNTMLVNLEKQPPDKIKNGPSIPLGEDLLKHINVNRGGVGNPGLLKTGGKLEWPLAFQADAYNETRQKFEGFFQDAVNQARTGPVGAGTVAELSRMLDQLNTQLSNTSKDLPPNQGIAARRFLANLGAAVRALQDPQVRNYLNGNWVASGATVADLVLNMASKGLVFAPAVTGDDESAYVALQNAMASFSEAVLPSGQSRVTAEH